MLKVAIIYHMWPHYRRAVMESLDRNPQIEFVFVGSGVETEGIKHVDPSVVRHFWIAPYRKWKRLYWQPRAISIALKDDFDALIFLGNPNFVSTWVAAFIARLRGIPVLFWEHGWRRRERRLKSFLRLGFFRIANRMLVYAPRAKALGAQAGYQKERIDVVYNSLDTHVADELYRQIAHGELSSLKPASFFTNKNLPVIICTARITKHCRFDLLLRAALSLQQVSFPINILLIGDGPERQKLEILANTLGVNVYFFGACYDELVLAQLIYGSEITVSPGKVGLTAMHSMMYGTPVITHDNDDEQMPEVAAIHQGRTGARFKYDDAESLAYVIRQWLTSAPDRAVVREHCRQEIQARWHPDVQANIIEKSVLRAINAKTSVK